MLLMNSHRTTVPYTGGNKNQNFLIILPTSTPKARLASPTFSGGSQPDFLFDFEFYDSGIFHMTFCYNLDAVAGLCEPNYAQVIVDYANWFFGLNIFIVKSGPFMIQNTGGVNAKLPASCTFWTARMLRIASGADPGDPVFGIFFVKTDTTGTTITFKPFKAILLMPYLATQADLDKPYSTYGFSSPVKASDFDFFIKKFSSGTYWNSIRVTDPAGNMRYFGNINSYRNHASDYVMIFWSPTFECESAEHVWMDANNVAVQPQSGVIARPNMNFFCLRKNVVLSVSNSLPAHTIFTHPSTATNLSLSESFRSVPTKNTTALATISGSSQSRTVKQTTWRNIYEVIEGLPANGALGVDVMLASFIDVPINSVFGWNISYQLITPEMPNVIFTNRVFSPLTFIRNDPPDVAATVDADEIIYTSTGGVLKDQNRRLGFISCKETVDSFVNKTTRVCQTITAMNTGTGKIYKVYEDYASGNIYVAAQSLADNLPYLFVLTLSNGTVDRLNVSLGNAQTIEVSIYTFTVTSNSVPYSLIVTIATSNVPGQIFLARVFNQTTFAQIPDATATTGIQTPSVVPVATLGGTFVLRGSTLYFHVLTKNLATNTIIIEKLYIYFNPVAMTFQLYRLFDACEGKPYPYKPKLQACFFDYTFVLYQEDVLVSDLDYPEFDFYFGASYSGYNSYKDYFKTYKLRFAELNLYKIKKVFCHHHTSGLLSIYAEKRITLAGGIIKTISVIATYSTIAEVRNRLVHVYETEKLFNSVTTTSYHRPSWSLNKYPTVFFDLRQFANSEIFVFKANPMRQKMYFNTTLQGPTYFTFLVKNDFFSKTVTVLFKPTSLPPILYTQQPKQPYITGLKLDIIPGIISSLTGHITGMYIDGDKGVTAITQYRSIKTNEANLAVQLMSQVGVDARVTMRRYNNTMFVYSASRCLLSIFVNQIFIQNYEFKQYQDCSTTFSNFRYYSYRPIPTNTSIYYNMLFFQGQDNFYYAFIVINLASLPVPGVTIGGLYKVYIRVPSTPPVDTLLNPANVPFFEITPKFYNGGGIFRHHLTYFDNDASAGPTMFKTIYHGIQLSSGVYFIDAGNYYPAGVNAELINPKVCSLAEYGIGNKTNNKHIICISSNYTDRVFAINLKSTTYLGSALDFEEIKLPTTSTTSLASIKILSCNMPDADSVECQCNSGTAGSSIIGFTISKNLSDTNPDCKINKLCGIGKSVFRYNVYPEGIVSDIKSQGLNFYVLLDSPSFPQGTNFIMVYNVSIPTVYTTIDLAGASTTDMVFDSDLLTTARMFMIDTRKMNHTIHNITEGRVTFSAQRLEDISGSLIFNNFNQKSIRLDLKSIFSEQYIAPPPPPPPLPPSFLSIYWPFFILFVLLSAAGVVVGRCLYKRNLALKEQERKKEKVINSLSEFYY
jgi:hypothetical protein